MCKVALFLLHLAVTNSTDPDRLLTLDTSATFRAGSHASDMNTEVLKMASCHFCFPVIKKRHVSLCRDTCHYVETRVTMLQQIIFK